MPHEYLGPQCSCNGVFIRGCRFYITQPGRSFAIRPPALPASQRGFPDRGDPCARSTRSSFTRPMVLITVEISSDSSIHDTKPIDALLIADYVLPTRLLPSVC